jgi:hypothetical protein
VFLFIHKDIPTLDFIDIATELTRFVYKKALDTLVHSISDKLSSPLETLKRRGIPVDRLLKNTEQQRKFSFNLNKTYSFILLAIKLSLQTKSEENIQSSLKEEQTPQKREQPLSADQHQTSQKREQPFAPDQRQPSQKREQPVAPDPITQNVKLQQYQESQRGFFQSLKK